MIKPLSASCALALSLTLVPLAYAEKEDDDEQGWEFELIIGAMSEPTYVGSDKNTTEAGFQPQAIYRSSHAIDYFIGLGELGASFQLANNWELITLFEYEEGRDNSDDEILTHFPEMEDTVEGQITLAKHFNHWTLASVFQPDILDRGKGLVYFVAAGYEQELTSKLSLESSIDISFANAEHMNTEVGISSDVAMRSGLSAYKADGGYKSTSLGLGLNYALNQQWALVSDLEVELYGKNIADSPLVKDEGSDTNYSLGVGVMYSF